MTTKFTSTSKNKKPSRRELRLSLLLPVVIIIVVWLIGLGVYTVTPGEVLFNQVIAILIGSSLIVTLIFYIRQAAPRLRVWALSMAVPALVGITVGVVNGRSTPILIGCGITILLLIAQRALSIPFSYRAAAQAFNRGEMNRALTLINKSIIARPDFAESYQLRALILINNLQANAAEQDAQKAISLQPQADQFYNTLGQIYLSTGRYADMRETYQNAVAINPDRAMHYYHLGLSHYRLGAYRDAAAAFSMATRKTIPAMAYDLLTHYYLWRSLLEIGEDDLAQTTHDTMQNFADALADLEAQWRNQPDFPYLTAHRHDVAELKQQLHKGI